MVIFLRCTVGTGPDCFNIIVISSDEENMNPHPGRGYRSHKGIDDELSTLPSPSSSVVDLDSNAGTVETEVLLSSFKGSRPSASGIQSK